MTTCHQESGAVVSVAGVARVALVGCPNAGKTTVFNQLTGLRAKTGNYPGVTVGRSVGIAKSGDVGIAVEDLPGTYSLDPISPDERVVADVLAGEMSDTGCPDAIVIVADATTLRRSVVLVAQVLRLDLPCLLALTMTDELSARGGGIGADDLSTALGIPVVAVVANRGVGVDTVRDQLASFDRWQRPPLLPPGEDDAVDAWGISVLDAAGYVAPQPDRRTRGIDAVVLHPLWGTAVFFAVMFCFFQVVFTVAAPLQDRVGRVLGWLGGLVSGHIDNDVVRGLLGQGLIGGVGTVLQFIPQIVLLFLLIALLENVGYMARAAFLMDRVMAVTGLEGRAFVAMLSSFACAIPGIMATRTLPSSRDRIATIITAPLMTCSARLPVFTLLVGLLVSPQTHWWGLSAQGVVMFLLYLCGGTSALIAASVFKSTILRSDILPFTMEFPPYRFPSPRNLLIAMWDSAKVFLRKAGTIILGTSLVLWALLNLPGRAAETASMSPTEASAYVMDHSYAADVGKAIGPAFKPLGFDWHINVALLGSLSAREVFVSALGQVSAATDPDNPHGALVALTDDDGHQLFSAPTVIALLAYFIFALQCMSTVAVMRRETNSWRWPAVAFSYMFGLAWLAAFAARSIAIGLGA
ncbi:ferrous iron transporter B [Mycobacterium persicum]|uniref:Fe(2+) transporter FeoB n=1 Tax=Mycobacterium persicum TaxID=1487726 RepID=A0A8E2IV81_9MYCO|nr:ferrous iron transporter B [Mycobacterium persicum]KZS86217.1 ferrous iron transporter B [Mycobacterium persicum]ORB95872.1 ferrous iron transporter B [Mycobacterium persicum]ORC02584.1 ferrous iron transporter B [Mycobacterium persicum]ORC07846.1 ferrous iron transporter B [Mycobacterium persicum]VAZ70880.1 Fe(2+) transporter FeoB [Mycobacterium persicum]